MYIVKCRCKKANEIKQKTAMAPWFLVYSLQSVCLARQSTLVNCEKRNEKIYMSVTRREKLTPYLELGVVSYHLSPPLSKHIRMNVYLSLWLEFSCMRKDMLVSRLA
jgi:hypothetical protein